MRVDHSPLALGRGIAPFQRGAVKAHVQDEQTRQWTLTVLLQGGRIQYGVKPTMGYGSATAGERPPLPAINTPVLVGFVDSDIAVEAYCIGALDALPYGVDRSDPFEDVRLHRSGFGRAVAPDGTLTVEFPGGEDHVVVGSGGRFQFLVRNPQGKPVKVRTPQRAVRIVADLQKGGLLLGARLLGGLTLLADAAKKKILLQLTERDSLSLQPGLVRVRTAAMVVGENDGDTAAVARWPEVEASLKALSRELQAVKHELVLQRAVNVQQAAQMLVLVSPASPLHYLLPVVEAILPIPLPLVTTGGKDGALVPGVGGVQIVDAGSATLQAE